MPNWTQADLDALQQRRGCAVTSPAPTLPIPTKCKLQVSICQTNDEAKLNKTEAQFLATLRTSAHQWLGVQAVTLKLGSDCRYTPDFDVVTPCGEIVFYEVKGFMRDDALVKLKTAARHFRWAKFILVKRSAGEWVYTEIQP